MGNLLVIGAQWGDEGKGKIIDKLAEQERFAAVVRYQGGDNAGHTVVVGNEKHAFHLLPSGILHPDKKCVIGNGVVINPRILQRELGLLRDRVGSNHAQLLVSEKAHLIMPWHTLRDAIAGGAIGTTGRGIGPSYADAVERRGIRLIDTRHRDWFARRVAEELEWNRHLIQAMIAYYRLADDRVAALNLEATLDAERITADYWESLGTIKANPLVQMGDVTSYLNQVQDSGRDILFEGAQATLLDIAHGTYPYVTSSYPTVGGVYVGTGFRPRDLTVIGVAKAYTTRVGAGPFPTELHDKICEYLRDAGHEFGTTTGRPRRCGWLDLPTLEYCKQVNGLDVLALTKLDVLTGLDRLKIGASYQLGERVLRTFTVSLEDLAQTQVNYEELNGWEEDITGVASFEELPATARDYVTRIETTIGVPITMIGVGPDREQLIVK